jgi:pathogenesis-related protein 1
MKHPALTAAELLIAACATLASAAHALTPPEQSEMIAAHNRWRQAAGVPDIRWSPPLAATAQQWADNLKNQQSCKPSHSPASGMGENLYWASPMRHSSGAVALQSINAAKVVDSWGSEKQDYDHAANTCAAGKMCGHYTQVVWRSTTDIGCAKAVCSDQSQVWVCNYTPPGNWRGQRPF